MKGIAVFYINYVCDLIQDENPINQIKEQCSEIIKELKSMDYKVMFIPVRNENTRFEVIELKNNYLNNLIDPLLMKPNPPRAKIKRTPKNG